MFCRFNKELQHQIHYLEVSGTGEAWSPQSPGHFQRGFFKESQESRSSKSSVPSVHLAQRKSCSIVTLLLFPLLSFILFSPLALEELCVTIEAGRCFQNLERREFKRLDWDQVQVELNEWLIPCFKVKTWNKRLKLRKNLSSALLRVGFVGREDQTVAEGEAGLQDGGLHKCA